MKQRGFSLYDIEEFLRDAGAERINDNAVKSLEMELEDTIKEMVGAARMYANYAGRKSVIKRSDVELAGSSKAKGVVYSAPALKRARRRKPARPAAIARPTVDLIAVKRGL